MPGGAGHDQRDHLVLRRRRRSLGHPDVVRGGGRDLRGAVRPPGQILMNKKMNGRYRPAEGEGPVVKHLLLAVATAVALAHASPALAQKEPPPDEIASKRLGVGYKIGNGLGFVGADVIVTLVDHVTLDLQANWFSVASEGSSASGYGVAPSLQLHLFKGQVSSPYLGLGYIYASASLDGVTASASGAV